MDDVVLLQEMAWWLLRTIDGAPGYIRWQPFYGRTLHEADVQTV